jgi:hypothetical protein
MALGNMTVDTGGELVEGLGYRDFTLSFSTQNIDFMNSPPVSLLGYPSQLAPRAPSIPHRHLAPAHIPITFLAAKRPSGSRRRRRSARRQPCSTGTRSGPFIRARRYLFSGRRRPFIPQLPDLSWRGSPTWRNDRASAFALHQPRAPTVHNYEGAHGNENHANQQINLMHSSDRDGWANQPRNPDMEPRLRRGHAEHLISPVSAGADTDAHEPIPAKPGRLRAAAFQNACGKERLW